MAATAPVQTQQRPPQGYAQVNPAPQAPQQVNAEPEPLRNLIVNYIPSSIDENQLRQLFENYGPTESVRIIRDRETKQSRGFGFVKYQYAMSAYNAIQYLNGYQAMNKRLKVAYANEAEAAQAQIQMNVYNPMMMGGMGMMMNANRQQRPPRQNSGYANGGNFVPQDGQQQQAQPQPQQ